MNREIVFRDSVLISWMPDLPRTCCHIRLLMTHPIHRGKLKTREPNTNPLIPRRSHYPKKCTICTQSAYVIM